MRPFYGLATFRTPCWARSGCGRVLFSKRHMHSKTAAAAGYPTYLEDRRDSFITDLTTPALWYPTARGLQRKIVAHLGPTNSGKTHSALEALKQADTGVYCGPLRLLAWEVAERLNSSGVDCNLVTGQERKEIPGAQHVACTVEMASVGRVVDVAIVDEIQMMGDRCRGWSFTRALLGLPARTLHVCGDPAVLPLLEQLCAEAGDELDVRWYERLSPLTASKRALGSLEKITDGDCVVAFSRRKVHSIRQQIEEQGKYKCCVLYGALPPEARSQQAVLFNTPRTGYNVMSASDAVGMGLNLNIRRVVFTSLSKFDGIKERPLTTGEIKQIAGRAGRYGSRFPSGKVTALHSEDVHALHEALAQPSTPVESACIFPSFTQLEQFASLHPWAKLHDILSLFAERALLGPQFFFAHFENIRGLAVMLKGLPLTLRECYNFCISPCDVNDAPVVSHLLRWAVVYSRRHGPVTLSHIFHQPLALALSEVELQQLEYTHSIYDLYCWLAYRFEGAFEGREEAGMAREACAQLIDESIRRIGALSKGIRRSSTTTASKSLEAILAVADAANAAASMVPATKKPRAFGIGFHRLSCARNRVASNSSDDEDSGKRSRGGDDTRRRSRRSRGADDTRRNSRRSRDEWNVCHDGLSSEEDEEWRRQDWQRRKNAYAKR